MSSLSLIVTLGLQQQSHLKVRVIPLQMTIIVNLWKGPLRPGKILRRKKEPRLHKWLVLKILAKDWCYGIHWPPWYPLHFALSWQSSAHLPHRLPCITGLVLWPFLICPKCLVPLDGTPSWSLSFLIFLPLLHWSIRLLVSILILYAFHFRFHSYCATALQHRLSALFILSPISSLLIGQPFSWVTISLSGDSVFPFLHGLCAALVHSVWKSSPRTGKRL